MGLSTDQALVMADLFCLEPMPMFASVGSLTFNGIADVRIAFAMDPYSIAYDRMSLLNPWLHSRLCNFEESVWDINRDVLLVASH